MKLSKILFAFCFNNKSLLSDYFFSHSLFSVTVPIFCASETCLNPTLPIETFGQGRVDPIHLPLHRSWIPCFHSHLLFAKIQSEY